MHAELSPTAAASAPHVQKMNAAARARAPRAYGRATAKAPAATPATAALAPESGWWDSPLGAPPQAPLAIAQEAAGATPAAAHAAPLSTVGGDRALDDGCGAGGADADAPPAACRTSAYAAPSLSSSGPAWPRAKFRRDLDGSRAPVSASLGFGGGDRHAPALPQPPSARNRRPAPAHSAPQPQQLYLDFGQRDVDNTRCVRCGMVWAPGVASEERAHARFCTETAGDVVHVPRRRGERVVAWLYAAGAVVTCGSDGGGDGAPPGAWARVIAVSSVGGGAGGGAGFPAVDALLARALGADSAPERRAARGAVALRASVTPSGAVYAAPPTLECVPFGSTPATTTTRWLAVAADGSLVAALVTEAHVTAFPGIEEAAAAATVGGGDDGGADAPSTTPNPECASPVAASSTGAAAAASAAVGGGGGAAGGDSSGGGGAGGPGFECAAPGAVDASAAQALAAMAAPLDDGATALAVLADADEDATSSAADMAAATTSACSARGRGEHANAVVNAPPPTRLRVDTAAPPSRCLLGVAQVWVRPDARRRGLATALLDAARAHAVYAYVVPPEALAFSQPTAAGAAFARAYLRRAAGEKAGAACAGGAQLMLYL